jgi:hypothetical protein
MSLSVLSSLAGSSTCLRGQLEGDDSTGPARTGLIAYRRIAAVGEATLALCVSSIRHSTNPTQRCCFTKCALVAEWLSRSPEVRTPWKSRASTYGVLGVSAGELCSDSAAFGSAGTARTEP